MPEPNSVFVSYAREDRETALWLYRALKRAGAKPWLDVEDLLPGQNWKSEIRNAIRESIFFLAVLSQRAVSKRGFVQSELKQALEVLEEFPESDVFVLPVRIDECTPSHERLKDLHWVDLFPSFNDGFRKILAVVQPDSCDASSPATTIPERSTIADTRIASSPALIIDDASSAETIDGYWALSDFAPLVASHSSTETANTDTIVRLVGGSALLDVVISNRTNDPLLLDTLECRTQSVQRIHVLSGGPGALDIAGIYKIAAHIDNDVVAEPMEPRLHVPGKDTIRFLVLFTADMTGCVNPNFDFRILVRGRGQVVADLGTYSISFSQLTASFEETAKELARRKAAKPKDIPTLVYAQVSGHGKVAAGVFSEILELEPENCMALSYFVSDYDTADECKLEYFYRLEQADPASAAKQSHNLVGYLAERAESAWKSNEHSKAKEMVAEARRLATMSGEEYYLGPVLEQELLIALLEDDRQEALKRIRQLSACQEWSEGENWQRDAVKRRISEALKDGWNSELEQYLFGP